MRIIILLLFLVNTSLLGAQNYKLFDASKESYYEARVNFIPLTLVSLRIDSVEYQGSDTLYQNFRIFGDVEPVGFNYCINYNDTNFFQGKVLCKSNGDYFFFNQNNDSILIKPQITLGNSWAIYTFSNGDYMEGTVSSKSQQNILGGLDSVKTISLQVKNSIGNPISHPFNSKVIQISKFNGLVKFYNTFNFPSDTNSFNLVGRKNIVSGTNNLTAAEIFDWNIGDQFHYYGWDNQAPWSAMEDYEQFNIIGKSVSVTGDTLIYSKDRQYYHVDYNFSPFDSTYYYIHDTIIDTIISSTNRLTNLSYEPFIDYSNNFFSNGYLYQFRNTLFNGRRQKEVLPYFSIYNGPDTCLNSPTGWCIHREFTYAEGLGLIRIEDCYQKDLVYFSKGTETFGNPINWSAVLNVEENLLTPEISIYPNPTNGNFRINATVPLIRIEIMNVIGEIIYSSKNCNSVTLESQSKGIYFIKAYDNSGKIIIKQIVIN